MKKINEKLKRASLTVLAAVAVTLSAVAQNAVQGYVHDQSDADGYEWPTDKAVLDKLDKWQDLKFGVLMHWGLYSVPGIVESWSICSEDVDWIRRTPGMAYDDYKKWYWGLKDSLNPIHFNPEKWADIMQDAGMKYMIFTTKHHDGFCMFDTKETDFSIAHGPFRNDPRRDIARHVFDAFRQKNFYIGCYFAKPYWHCPYCWSPEFATPNRRINYKPERHPGWFEKYVSFTQRQLNELTSNYGRLDLLWLDGGWISGEQIGLDSILVEARKRNPGMLSVDRMIKGHNENYQTPERGVPQTKLDIPWESCITLSNDWGWTPNAPYKSSRWVINTLAEITAKGGCFVLGIGPTAQGTFEDEVVKRLHEVGQWLKRYGRAIYSTRPVDVYHDGNVWFTGSKDKKTVYAIYALPEKGQLPAAVSWKGNLPRRSVRLLSTGKRLKYTVSDGDRVCVTLPEGMTTESFALEIR